MTELRALFNLNEQLLTICLHAVHTEIWGYEITHLMSRYRILCSCLLYLFVNSILFEVPNSLIVVYITSKSIMVVEEVNMFFCVEGWWESQEACTLAEWSATSEGKGGLDEREESCKGRGATPPARKLLPDSDVWAHSYGGKHSGEQPHSEDTCPMGGAIKRASHYLVLSVGTLLYHSEQHWNGKYMS